MLSSTVHEIFFLLINVKMPTTVGILTFMSGKNSILGLAEPKKAEFLLYTYEHLKFELSMKIFFITSGHGRVFEILLMCYVHLVVL